MVYRQPTLAPLGRPVEGDHPALFAAKRSKGCQPGEMAVYNPRENRCRARKPDIYFTMVVSFRTTRRAFHASASVFAVPDPEVSETRGSWFEHPAMPLGFGALCAVPGATSWCVFCPFSRCQRVPYRNVAMPIDARVRPPRAVPGDPRARVGLPRSESPIPALTAADPASSPPVRQVAPGRRDPASRRACAGAMAPSAVPPRPGSRRARGPVAPRRFSGCPVSSPSRLDGTQILAGQTSAACTPAWVRLEQAGWCALGVIRRIARVALLPELNPGHDGVQAEGAAVALPRVRGAAARARPGRDRCGVSLPPRNREWFNDAPQRRRLGPREGPGSAAHQRLLRRRTTFSSSPPPPPSSPPPTGAGAGVDLAVEILRRRRLPALGAARKPEFPTRASDLRGRGEPHHDPCANEAWTSSSASSACCRGE